MTKQQSNFKKAVALAKQLQKKQPSLKYIDAIKKAFAQLKVKKVGAAKKSSSTPKHKDTSSHNVNIRVVSGVNKKLGAIKIIQKGENKNAKVTKTFMQIRDKKKGTFKGYRKIAGIDYNDKDAAIEIKLYADSNSSLYFQRKLPILKNLQNKFKTGKYDVDKAAKLFMLFINDAMKRYNNEYGSKGDKWHELLSMGDRKLLAHEYAIDTLNEFKIGNFII